MCSFTQDDGRNLLRRFRDGDEEAFRILFDRHVSSLQARTRRRMPGRLSRRISIADIVQEAFFVAFRRRADFVPNGPDSLRAWLLGIVDHKVRETIRFHECAGKRAVGREVTRGRRTETGRFAGRQATPSQHAMANEVRTRARAALEVLSPDDREVLRLARELQLPLREVAQRTGRSYEAARKHYARALVRFRKAFEGLGGAE